MATYVNNLRLKEITTGDEDGVWGTSTNTNLGLITDGFSYGTKEMAADANETFTMPDATADATRSLYLKFTSAVSLTATREITLGPNTVSKTWIIENATTGSQIITIKQGSGATVNVANGSKVMVVTDGAGAGAAVLNANPTEAVVDLTSDVTGTLPVANGGTGVTTSTGTGSTVLSTSPTLVTPLLGTPTSGTLTNCTGLPAAGVTGTAAILGANTFTGAQTFNSTLNNFTLTAPATSATINTRADNLTHSLPEISGNLALEQLQQNSQSTAYTTVLGDAGKHILHPAADTTARIFTIDSNANVAYPIGTAITFVNENAAGVITIAITSDTMRLAGAGTTGSRTLAANGVATALKITSTSWIISGTGLT